MQKTLLGKSSEYGNVSLFNHSKAVLNYGLYILKNIINIEDIDINNLLYHAIVAFAFHDIGKCDSGIQNILQNKKPSNVFSHNIFSWAYLMGTDFNGSSILPSVLFHHPVEIFNKNSKEEYNLVTIWKELKKEKNKINYDSFFNEMNDYLINIFPEIYKPFQIEYNEYKGKEILSNVSLDGTVNGMEYGESLFRKAETTIIRSVLITADRMVSEDYKNNEKYLNNNISYMKEKFDKETILNDNIKDINLFELKDNEGKYVYSDKERLTMQGNDLEKILSSKKNGIILSASAGYGKTLIGIKWLMKNRTKSYWVVPRNVIATSTYESINEELGKMGSPMTVGLLLTGEFKHGNENSDIIVTNIDNFLYYGIKNNMSINMAKIMSSNVIFDEFHEFFCKQPLFAAFIDFINIRLLFTKDNTKTLMMSATPLSYDGLLYGEYIDKIEAHSFNGDMKVNMKYLNLNSITDLQGKIENDSFIICDTIKNAQDIYETNKHNGLLIHTLFTPERREEIERKIKKNHNKHSAINNREIIYGTNIIGVGLDISAKHIYDVVITPENTIQRGCGRGGRFSEKEYNSEIDYYVCDIGSNSSNMGRMIFTSHLSNAWLNILKEYDGKILTKNDQYGLYNKFYIDNKVEIKKLYKKRYKESYEGLKSLKPYRCNSNKIKDEKKLSKKNNFRGKSTSIYVVAPYSEDSNTTSTPITIDSTRIHSNEFEQNRSKVRFNEISINEDFNSKQRKILKDKFEYDKNFYYSRALNKDTPFKLFDATYSDNIGLRLNNDDFYDEAY